MSVSKESLQYLNTAHWRIDGFNQAFRKELDLYANVVKVRSLPGVNSRHRTLTLLSSESKLRRILCIEHESVKGVVEMPELSPAHMVQYCKVCFDYATRHGRKKVTVHKAIMKLGDGLFLKCCEEVAKLYPN